MSPAAQQQKLQRTYELRIEGDPLVYVTVPPTPTIYTISYPLTLDLEVNRNTLASANTARLTLRNLAPATRRGIFHDLFAIGPSDYRTVELNAGYETDASLPIIFRGQVETAASWREGTDWVTEITAKDGAGAIANGQVDTSRPKGWNMRDVMGALIGAMGPTVGLNAVGNLSAQNSRGVVLSGNAWDLVQKFNPYGLNFIDNGAVSVLKMGEYLQVPWAVPLITSESGLLGTPRRFRERVEVPILFEPRVAVGQIVEIRSLEGVNDGLYQVTGFRHSGTISGAVDHGMVTTLSLWVGASRLIAVTGRNVRGFSQ